MASSLEIKLASARKVVDRLTPALLAKAFRGELVPQDPCEEPATVLLDRLAAKRRAARQAEAGAGKPSRRGRRKAAAHPDQASLGLASQPVGRATAPSDPNTSDPAIPPPMDLLARLLQDCGPLSEKALLAASELEPAGFRRQLQLELQVGTLREELEEAGVTQQRLLIAHQK